MTLERLTKIAIKNTLQEQAIENRYNFVKEKTLIGKVSSSIGNYATQLSESESKWKNTLSEYVEAIAYEGERFLKYKSKLEMRETYFGVLETAESINQFKSYAKDDTLLEKMDSIEQIIITAAKFNDDYISELIKLGVSEASKIEVQDKIVRQLVPAKSEYIKKINNEFDAGLKLFKILPKLINNHPKANTIRGKVLKSAARIASVTYRFKKNKAIKFFEHEAERIYSK